MTEPRRPETIRNTGQRHKLSVMVDVVVPAYGGKEETRRCLQSLLAGEQATPFDVIVVNDASPEPELVEYLEELAARGLITLISNDTNIGFVDSANLGMMMHLDRDVVLLNSDTQVHGDWLDRLRRCASDNPGTGTVTPFSNNATICSYPRFLEDNPLPEGWNVADLDIIFRETNRDRSVEIPTAVGFCTYITRRCIDATGYLDSLHFGRGYGEENDFCMRAAFAGFSNRLCGDVFVYHQGGASFGRTAQAASDSAQATLRVRHPQYEPTIHAHFHKDPERELRRRVDIARLADSPRKKILLITHRLGGGTEKHVQELAKLLEPEIEVLIMRPTDFGSVSIEWARSGEEFAAYFHWPNDYAEMINFLRGLSIERIHFHHLVEYEKQVLKLPENLEIGYDFTAHDYYVLCPLYNLIGAEGKYCGEPDAAGCAACLSRHESLAGLDINDWRGRWADLINGADRVIVPSNDVAARLRRYFPEASYVCLPHPEAADESENLTPLPVVREVKVLVLGDLSVAKGTRLLEACAADARQRGLPLCFRLLGWARDDIRQEPDIPLFFLGPYDDRQLPLLIERERADVIFFPALWPETYSYTLSAAMRSGLPIAAPRLGAFTERLADYESARLMDFETDARDWNDLFLSMQDSGKIAAPDIEGCHGS